MCKRVIIYGFGWVGQSVFALCKALGLECRIVDDGLLGCFVEDEHLVGIEVLREPFALCLVAVQEESIADKILLKLENMGIHKSLVRHIHSDAYFPAMKHLVPTFFDSDSFLEFLKSESFELPNFHIKLQKLATTYYATQSRDNKERIALRAQIDSAFPERNVFAKMFNMATIKGDSPHIHYPGFNIHGEIDQRADKDFFFEKFDWDLVRNRDSKTKIIACFGNDALRQAYLPLEATITEYLRKELRECKERYIVLNLGVCGHTIYEQLMLYNALFYHLKPEIVLSFFGGIDWISGFFDCALLVKNHKLIYSTDYSECQVRKFIQSVSLLKLKEFPLLCEIGSPSASVDVQEIHTAILARLRQFHAIVSAGGGAICRFYPATFVLQDDIDTRRGKNVA